MHGGQRRGGRLVGRTPPPARPAPLASIKRAEPILPDPTVPVVQPALQQEQKVLARDALLARGLLEVVAELAFEDEVNALDLLLLAQLLAVADQCLAAPHRIAVLPRRLR